MSPFTKGLSNSLKQKYYPIFLNQKDYRYYGITISLSYLYNPLLTTPINLYDIKTSIIPTISSLKFNLV